VKVDDDARIVLVPWVLATDAITDAYLSETGWANAAVSTERTHLAPNEVRDAARVPKECPSIRSENPPSCRASVIAWSDEAFTW